MSKTILSVNSNKAMTFLLQTIVENEYDFVSVTDVFQAMHQLKIRKKFSCLLVDIDFNQQQAWELIEHIESSKMYRIPIIVLATENTELLRQKCYEYEIEEIFFKPFNPVDVITAIQNTTVSTVFN